MDSIYGYSGYQALVTEALEVSPMKKINQLTKALKGRGKAWFSKLRQHTLYLILITLYSLYFFAPEAFCNIQYHFFLIVDYRFVLH